MFSLMCQNIGKLLLATVEFSIMALLLSGGVLKQNATAKDNRPANWYDLPSHSA